MGTGSFDGKIQGLNQLQAQEQKQYGPGNYMPRVELMYWSMRVMAMLGVVMFLIAAVGAWLYRKRRLEKARWFLWTAVVAIAFPYLAATFGWILTEMGRQPWIVQGLLKTSQAVSPNVSTAMVATSLGVFVLLYLTPWRGRLHPHAPLRPGRSATGARTGGGRDRTAGGCRGLRSPVR